MTNDIKELIKYEYENGTSMSVLSKKYNVKINTIKSWSYKEKWIKKKQNQTTKRGTTTTPKKQPKKVVVNEKELEIKKDILNEVPKEEIMSNYGISERTYYRKSQSIRKMRLEATERQAQSIIEEVYADLPDFLRNIAIAKRNTAIRIIKVINSENSDEKEIAKLEKKLNLITKTEKEIMRTGKMLTTFELFDIEAQLVDENIKNEYLQLEKAKLEKDESEKEIEMIELLRNITNKVEKDE